MSFGFSAGDFIAVLRLANDTRKQFVDAPGSFTAISNEVKSLSTVLRDIEDVLPQRDLTDQQKSELCDISKRCHSVLEELNKKLNEFKELDTKTRSLYGKPQRVWKRLKWDQNDIDRFRSRVGSNILLFNTFLGRISSQVVFETRDGVERLHERQDYQEYQQEAQRLQKEHEVILSWITTIDYSSQQNDFISQRQEGTGQWLLASAEFQEWMKSDKQTMFCPGIPGAGKTFIASTVIEELTMKFKNEESIGIAYLYCNYRRHGEQKVDNLLASLLRQLIQGRSSIPEGIKHLYNDLKDHQTRPPLNEIYRSLISVAETYSRVYIIVDAVDECQETEGHRKTFLSKIFNLQVISGINIFATSRHIPEIVEEFSGSIKLEIRASSDDVRRYVDGHLTSLPSFVRRNSDLQEEIKIAVVKAVDGMFLLALLHLNSLVGKKSPKAIRTALEKLPSGCNAYDVAYKEAMMRIEGQVPDQAELAKQVLSWITYAYRPLTTLELQHALAVEENSSELDEDNLPDIEDLIRVCVGLVRVDEESEVIRLVHYTTQEYFQRTKNQWFPNADLEITTVCATYLSFDTFKNGFCQTGSEFRERLQKNKLYDYAAKNWGHHAQANAASCQTVIEFLKKQGQVEASSEALLSGGHMFPYGLNIHHPPRKVTGLHLVGYFGIDDGVPHLIEKYGPHPKDGNGQTPLSWAAHEGHETVAKLLLKNGADANLKDRSGSTSLFWAVYKKHEAIIKLLLESGAGVIKGDNYGTSPLFWSVYRKNEALATARERCRQFYER